jgi:hypothetical protein
MPQFVKHRLKGASMTTKHKADELADALNRLSNAMYSSILNQAATMLRQQQAEIEALKDQISTLRYERSSGVYDGEPVAWGWKRNGKIYDVICPKEHARAEGGYTVPLYDHPAKTLTVDEDTIFELAHEYGCYEGDRVGFVNAILKKASE